MKILAVAGASGGHIFPAISFFEALKKEHADFKTILVIPRRGAKIQIAAGEFNIKYISIFPVNLSFTRSNFIALLNLFKGLLQSLKLIFGFRPDIVIGFGGLESIPLLFFAWIFRLKTLIHEQNVLPGRANRLLAKFVDKVAISFIETKNYLKIFPDKIVLTGNPVLERLKPVTKKEALEFFGFNENKFTILALGGSQGSHSINSAFLGAVVSLEKNYKIQVIHISGAADYDFLSARYNGLSSIVKTKIFSFLKEMQYAYSACDLAVTRAGATTIAELLLFRVPAVIIPYPYAYNHQLENAKIIEKIGAAVVIEDNEAMNMKLKNILDEFVNNPDKIKAMKDNFNNYDVKSNAGDLLVKAVCNE
jgi:UDP-N-acetylglucosamine--N-acetylmuramyl-(pentapeptide) pyrophosphoryl-undecaprenol N-acetylglucosamine transferase